MKVHTQIQERAKEVEASMQKVGLDMVPDALYSVYKLSSKNPARPGYASEGLVIKGHVSALGDGDVAAVYIEGLRDWFRTSAVVSTKKTPEGYEIETLNSVYLLKPMGDN